LDPAKPQALLTQCGREYRLGDMDAAAATAKRIIRSRSAEASPALRLDARIRLIAIEFRNGRHDAALAAGRIAVRLARSLGDQVRESLARSSYARVLIEESGAVEAAKEVFAALRLSRVTDAALARSTACANLALICSRLSLYDAAVDIAREAVVQAERAGDPEAIGHAVSNYGSLHADYLYRYSTASAAVKEGYLTFAIDESRRVTEFAHAHEDGEVQRVSGYNLVEFLLMRGDLAGAEAAMRQTEAAPGVTCRRAQVHRGHTWALLLLAQGHPGALPALEDSLERCLAYPYLELALFASEHRSRLLAKFGRYEEAFAEHRRFHALFLTTNNEDHSQHIQYSVILDQIGEMRTSLAAENARADELSRQYASLSSTTERLARETLEDALTGLGNRRRLEQVLTEFATKKHAFAIAILDLDHFKRANDGFSHAVGDAVLRRVGQIMRATLASCEGVTHAQAFRLGGEEFAITLAKATATIAMPDARAACELVRGAIAAWDWGSVAPGLMVTASLGVAMSDEAPDAAGQMSVADARLYDAKHAGRNLVVSDDAGRLARAP
jgi:two-component system cell cycle response regulator